MKLIDTTSEIVRPSFFHKIGRIVCIIVSLMILCGAVWGYSKVKGDGDDKSEATYVVDSRTAKYIDVLKPGIDPSIRDRIANAIDSESFNLGIPPELICSLIKSESNFRPDAISYVTKGRQKKPCAYGLMQVNPDAHPEIHWQYSLSDLCNIETNIHEGCRLLKIELNRSSTHHEALGRYVGSQAWKDYKIEILSNTSKLYAMGN